MGNSGGVQMPKVSIQQVKAGMGYLGERLVRVCRGIIKEAKAQLVLYTEGCGGAPGSFSISATKEGKRKMRAHWERYLIMAKGMEKSEILSA